MKKVIFIVLIVFFSFGILSAADTNPWVNICPSPGISYCNDIGKNAYNDTGNNFLDKFKLGKIIGIAWRPKGSLIGFSEAIPQAGIPVEVRTSPRDAYYYIIDDGGDKPFLRQGRENMVEYGVRSLIMTKVNDLFIIDLIINNYQ